MAENGIEGGVRYVEKNKLGTVRVKQLLSLEYIIDPRQTVKRRKEEVFFPNHNYLLLH